MDHLHHRFEVVLNSIDLHHLQLQLLLSFVECQPRQSHQHYYCSQLHGAFITVDGFRNNADYDAEYEDVNST